jgi:hypothetical protein
MQTIIVLIVVALLSCFIGYWFAIKRAQRWWNKALWACSHDPKGRISTPVAEYRIICTAVVPWREAA